MVHRALAPARVLLYWTPLLSIVVLATVLRPWSVLLVLLGSMALFRDVLHVCTYVHVHVHVRVACDTHRCVAAWMCASWSCTRPRAQRAQA